MKPAVARNGVRVEAVRIQFYASDKNSYIFLSILYFQLVKSFFGYFAAALGGVRVAFYIRSEPPPASPKPWIKINFPISFNWLAITNDKSPTNGTTDAKMPTKNVYPSSHCSIKRKTRMNSAKRNGIFMLVTLIAAAFASNQNQPEESVLLSWIFLGFVGAIILFQLIPGYKLFLALLKDAFYPSEQNSECARKK